MTNDKVVRAISMQSTTTITTTIIGTCSPSRRERAIISFKRSLVPTFSVLLKAQECYTKDILWLRKIGKSHLINTIRLMIK